MKASKQLVIGDVHLKQNNLDVAEQLFKLIDESLLKHYPDKLVFLGDIYDTKAIIRSEAQNFLIEKLLAIQSKYPKMPIIIIVGNHDLEHLATNENALRPLDLIQNVKVVDRFLVEDDCAYINYFHNNSDFNNILNQIPHSCKWVFCHQGFDGFDYGNGIVDQSGFKADGYDKWFICGHYHKYQEKGNVLYLGTPFSHSFGEVNQDKFIAMFDSSIGDSPSECMLKILTSKSLPSHKKVTFKDGEKFCLSNVESKDLIEVVVECKQNEVEKYGKDWALKELGFEPSQLRVKYEFIDEQVNIRIKENQSFEEMVKEYLEKKNLSKYYNASISLLSEVS